MVDYEKIYKSKKQLRLNNLVNLKVGPDLKCQQSCDEFLIKTCLNNSRSICS